MHTDRRLFFAVLMTAACCMLIYSCRSAGTTAKRDAAPAGDETVTTAVSQPPAHTRSAADNTAATVNGSIITTEEVDRAFSSLQERYQSRVSAQQLEQMRPGMQKKALEELINKELLLQEARRQNLQPGSEQIAAGVEKARGRFPSEEAFNDKLASLGLSADDLRREVEEQLVIQALLEKKFSTIEPASPAALKTFYNENIDRFSSSEQVRARHILVKLKGDEPPEAKEKKRRELKALRAQIIQGADFAELAGEHSECPSKRQGGDLGFFTRDRMVKPFSDAAFSLSVGEVSTPVETSFGYHVIQVTDKKEAKTIPFAEAKERIEKFLQRQEKQRTFTTYLEELRGQAVIEYPQENHR